MVSQKITNPQQRFVVYLFNARNRVRFAMDEAFKPLGVTDATWRTLFYLEQTGSGVSQKELAMVMGIEGPSLVRLLDSLEAKNLIERRAAEQDRRRKEVHLTRKAHTLLGKLHKVAEQVRGEILKDLPKDEIEVCTRVLEQIAGVRHE